MMIDRRTFVGAAAASAILPVSTATAFSPRTVDDVIDRFARDHSFSGTIAMARHGRIKHQRVFGFADRENRIPVTPSTSYRIGSISKWFTAVAALGLVELGKFRLEAPMRTYLPELTGAYGAVPLVYLLSNSSGIPDRITQAIGTEPSLRESLAGSAEIVLRFRQGPLAFEPGERFDYSFFNWVLIHAAMERVRGRLFEQVIEQQLFAPIGLRRSAFVDTRGGEYPGLARAYSKGGTRKDALVPPFGGAGGNIVSNAADLALAAHAVFETNRILKPNSRAALASVRVESDHYALGGRVLRLGNADVAWETGKVQGYRTHLAHVIGRDRAVIIFNNGDMEQDIISRVIEELIQLA